MDWGELYSHVIACTGWTWDYIAENLDLPRLQSLNEYWDQFPPIHIMVASYMGIDTKPKVKPGREANQDFEELFRMFPPPQQ